jgi:hypothetical protein
MARVGRIPLLLMVLSVTAAAQAPEPPLDDTRLTVHTLVREDIFAGFLRNDVARLARAEKNLELLLASRPAERPSILAWQGSAAFTRAVLAQEASQPEAFRQQYARTQQLFGEAMKLGPDAVGVFAIVGGTSVMLSDRLPPAERGASWERANTAYQRLWQMQAGIIDKLPLHHKGEVLAGLAESAHRTGREQDAATYLDRILVSMPDTAYAARARQWMDDVPARASSKLACQTCHGPGTLAARMAEVRKQ